MRRVMLHLGLEIPTYNRSKDPIFFHAIRLHNSEQSTTTQPCLEEPSELLDLSTPIKQEESTVVDSLKTDDLTTNENIPDTMSAYPASFFAALPFLSMGLPFPPMYMYPHLTPFFYYPFLQLNDLPKEPPKPKAACYFCMETEGSLTCLYYQRDAGEGTATVIEVENEHVTDTTSSITLPKNPGWFGKGYRKGLKRKR